MNENKNDAKQNERRKEQTPTARFQMLGKVLSQQGKTLRKQANTNARQETYISNPLFTVYCHSFVQMLAISVNLETGLKLGECARTAVEDNVTPHECLLTYHKYVLVHGQAVHYGNFMCFCS